MMRVHFMKVLILVLLIYNGLLFGSDGRLNILLLNSNRFICLNVEFNGTKKVLIIQTTAVINDFFNRDIDSFEAYFKRHSLDDVFKMDANQVRKYKSDIFPVSGKKAKRILEYFSRDSIVNKKTCTFNEGAKLDREYRCLEWFYMIYYLWSIDIICEEDSEMGYLSIYCVIPPRMPRSP